jgi:hypothetical protein
MSAGARAFFEGIIDYAGLFPPAELPFHQALTNYLRYRREAESWMLSRFICPVARLGELAPFQQEIYRSGPLRLAVLGRNVANDEQFTAAFTKDCEDIQSQSELLAKHAVVECYEIKFPPGGGESLGWLANSLTTALQLAPSHQPEIFLEFLKPDMAAAGWKLGCKLRTGGLQAAAFPSPEQVAAVLAQCCRSKTPWKATAGLHHPIRRFDASVDTNMHGFVNVFGAAILLHAGRIAETQVVEVLGDEDPNHFCFDDTGFAWMGRNASVDEIRSARKIFTTFGSCSFDEPRDDLRQLGWI